MFVGVGAMFMVLGLAFKLVFKNGLAGDIAALLWVLAGVAMLVAGFMKRK